MTVLPIVGRELVVAARRAATYWTRFGVAALALAVFLLVCLTENGTADELGKDLFIVLGVPTLGFCLLAGVFITADSLSVEKREGTLGLLFLTDLKGYDVVLGKLAANSVHAIFGLLAVFPVLALPLLTGGVSGGEFWRTVLVFVDTLYLSLSVGMLVSAASRDGRLAMAGTFVLLVMIAGMLPLGWVFVMQIHVSYFPLATLTWPNPAYAYYKGFDSEYISTMGRRDFWSSIGVIAIMATACIVAASLALPRLWQKSASARRQWTFHWLQLRPVFLAKRPRRELLDRNPFQWLAMSDRGGRFALNLVVAGLSVAWFACVLMSMAQRNSIFSPIAIYFVFFMHLTAKIMMASESGRRFHQDRQSGVMELLLATPLSVKEIVAGQKEALRAQFRRAIFLLGLINLLAIVFVLGIDKPSRGEELASIFEAFVGGAIVLWLDAEALSWVGMWRGLNGKKYPRAVLGTITQVMVVPWVTMIVFALFVESRWNVSEGETDVLFAGWLLFGAVIDLARIAAARKKLGAQFRAIAAQRYDG